MSKPLAETIEKVTCHVCQHFMGHIKSDGTGPAFEKCNEHWAGNTCPMYEKLGRFQPNPDAKPDQVHQQALTPATDAAPASPNAF